MSEIDDMAKAAGLINAGDKGVQKIYKAIRALRDDERDDRGYGDGYMDVWVKIAGVEYFVTIRRSNNQLKKDTN